MSVYRIIGPLVCSGTHLFIPSISFQSPLTQDSAAVVRVAYAENIAQLAETALR